MADTLIDIGRDFSRFPAGRYRADGPFSGQRFREDLLVPALRAGGTVAIAFDSAMGFGSSFLEEAFGGIFRETDLTPQVVGNQLRFLSSDQSIVDEIKEYLNPSDH